MSRLPEAPLTNADYARIRARVREKVRRSPLVIRRFAFAMLVLLIVILLVPHRQPRSGAPGSQPAVAGLKAGPATVAVALPAAPQPATAVVQHHHPRTHRPKPRKPETQLVRMEIQTADPNVRIIWIAQ